MTFSPGVLYHWFGIWSPNITSFFLCALNTARGESNTAVLQTAWYVTSNFVPNIYNFILHTHMTDPTQCPAGKSVTQTELCCGNYTLNHPQKIMKTNSLGEKEMLSTTVCIVGET